MVILPKSSQAGKKPPPQVTYLCVGTYPETSSPATCQGTLGHGRLSSLSHCGPNPVVKSELIVHELISTFKKKKEKSAARECIAELSLQILAARKKKTKQNPAKK